MQQRKSQFFYGNVSDVCAANAAEASKERKKYWNLKEHQRGASRPRNKWRTWELSDCDRWADVNEAKNGKEWKVS